MPEEESGVMPPEPGVPPAELGTGVPDPAPGSVPLGTPFAPEPGSETPYTAGPPADEGEASPDTVAGGPSFSDHPAPENPGAAFDDAARIASDVPGGPASGFTPPPGRPDVSGLDAPSDDDRLMAALAWISMVVIQVPLVSVVLLLAEGSKNRPFQRYHATTSILLWVGAVGYEMLAAIAYIILSAITLGCLACCLWVIFLVPHAIAIWYAIQAYQGKYSEIPFISDFARRQHWA